MCFQKYIDALNIITIIQTSQDTLRGLASCLVWTSFLIFAHGQTGEDAKALRTKLFTTDAYDRTIRPIDNQTAPLGMTLVINFKAEAIPLKFSLVEHKGPFIHSANANASNANTNANCS